MSYRDDQDAALARADALQVELDRSRGELERTKATLAQRDADLAASEDDRKALAARAPAATAVPQPKRIHPALSIGLVALGFVAIVVLVICRNAQHERESAEKQKQFERDLSHSDLGAGTLRSCTVRTVPSGAEVVSVDAAGSTYSMGTTPYSRSIGSWTINGERLEARLDGYQTIELTEPAIDWSTSACDATFTLVPLNGR